MSVFQAPIGYTSDNFCGASRQGNLGGKECILGIVAYVSNHVTTNRLK